MHPNNDFGESKEWFVGRCFGPPIIGEKFNVYPEINTSPVTKIIDENTFHTLNSIYYFEELYK